MRASDLIEVSDDDRSILLNTDWQNSFEVADWLEKNGFEKLGGGFFAHAYARPGSDEIVKFNNRQDRCWIAYAQVIKQMSSPEPFYPKITDIRRYGGQDIFFIAVMERLLPIEYNDLLVLTPEDLAYLLTSTELYVVGDYRGAIKKLSAVLPDIDDFDPMSYNDTMQRMRDYAKANMTPFTTTIEKLKNFRGCDLDLHKGNLMKRPGTNQIVITDPVAGAEEL